MGAQFTTLLESSGPVIAQARRLAVEFLDTKVASDGIPVSARTRDITQLVVSELVTNAHKYAPGPVHLGLRVREGMVEIAVWDTDPTLPAPRTADPGRIGQHGLEIVQALADTFDARPAPGGKRVSARISLSIAEPAI
ncbi:ATP-binding protein (plasmid) [Streptomyces sp. NBC_01218]|uniref:ATP-binding protein n=1 Tax=Streptomyces sp. NBC_01218 TaxID=2903780 RepID=UPI002E117AEB|nr:ATP-binding protein [Streptomyces sp. NBC_01218]